MKLLAFFALLGLVSAESEDQERYEDTPQAAFENAAKNQMVMVVRADPAGHSNLETVDAMVFTTENPQACYDELVAQTDTAWDAIDENHELHFSYRITEPVPAQVRIKDDQSLWSAFIMASYLDIDVPVLYAEMYGEIVWDELHWWNFDASHFIPPTPEPTATPTVSGLEIDGIKYIVHYCRHGLVWDNSWKGDRIVIEDNGVTARMFTGNGHENIRTETCFSEGQHMWRLQYYTNDDQRQSNVEWMVSGIVTEGEYFDSYNVSGRTCGILAHSNANYCATWGGYATGGWEALAAQETFEILLDCDEGRMSYRRFEEKDTFATMKVPVCDSGTNCLYPWLQMHYSDRFNSGTILGEPVEYYHNEWDGADYKIAYDLVWDEDWMGDRIQCERDCKVARMFSGNGHENTRTTTGFTEGKNAWRLKLYADDDQRNTQAEWLVPGIVTEGDYFDGYNENGRSCGILAHSVTNYCNSWGYVKQGANDKTIPSMHAIILMLDSDEGILYYQFQGRPEPWVAFNVPANELLYPWCQMHYGDRKNACILMDTLFEFENVNHHYEENGNNGR